MAVCKLALPEPTKTPLCTQRGNQTQRRPRTAATVLDLLLWTAGKYKILLGEGQGLCRSEGLPIANSWEQDMGLWTETQQELEWQQDEE